MRRRSMRGRRLLAQDPLHEPAHQESMRLYAAAGRRSDALRQYRECVRVLERELPSHRSARRPRCTRLSRRMPRRYGCNGFLTRLLRRS